VEDKDEEDSDEVGRREDTSDAGPFFFPFFIWGAVGINPQILLISGVRKDCGDNDPPEVRVTEDGGRGWVRGGGSNGGGDGIGGRSPRVRAVMEDSDMKGREWGERSSRTLEKSDKSAFLTWNPSNGLEDMTPSPNVLHFSKNSGGRDMSSSIRGKKSNCSER
jgi:hypothetical protein